MPEALAVALTFPTVGFTVLLSLVVLYWLFVVIGAVDFDGASGAAGAGKGALEGVAKGALEGAAKGALEGVAKGALGAEAVDVSAGHDAPVATGAELEPGLLSTLVHALRLRTVPATVVLSFFALFGWLASGLSMLSLGELGWGTRAGVLFGAAFASLLLTSLTVRPLGPLFAMRAAPTSEGLEGKVAVVSTGEVTPTYGQATLEDGGAGLILQVRTDGVTRLRRGDHALLIAFDPATGAFLVERLPTHDDDLVRVAPEASAANDERADERADEGDRASGERISGVRRT
jgi:hypothetical protein